MTLLYLGLAALYVAFFFTRRRPPAVLGRVLVPAGLLLHLVYLLALGLAERKIPLTSLSEALSALSFLLALLYLVLHLRQGEGALGAFLFPLVLFFQLTATGVVQTPGAEVRRLLSPLFYFHTLTSLVGYGAFAFSMVQGIMYLHLFHEIRSKRLRWIFERLPPLETMDRWNGAALVVGFVLLTLGLASGARMARGVWQEYSILDLKIFLSVLLWFLYLFGILMRRLSNWNGRRMSYLAVIGFIVLLFTFVAADLAFVTVHDF